MTENWDHRYIKNRAGFLPGLRAQIGTGSVHFYTTISLFRPAVYALLRYSSMAAAAFLPAPIARITVAAPVTASPPA